MCNITSISGFTLLQQPPTRNIDIIDVNKVEKLPENMQVSVLKPFFSSIIAGSLEVCYSITNFCRLAARKQVLQRRGHCSMAYSHHRSSVFPLPLLLCHTGGKIHDIGFMAFDCRMNDTCHRTSHSTGHNLGLSLIKDVIACSPQRSSTDFNQ
jgi:hypothetical protein